MSYWVTWRKGGRILHLFSMIRLKMLGYGLMWDANEITRYYHTGYFTHVFKNIKFLVVIEAEVIVWTRFKFLPTFFFLDTLQTFCVFS